MPPTKLLSPTPDTATAGSTPARCMYRTFRAMPPMLAGVTRLTNEDPTWVASVGPNGRRLGTEPMAPSAAAKYVAADMTTITISQLQSADWNAFQLLPTSASWGRR